MSLTFFYDVVCPYAYIASRKVAKLSADTGLKVQYKPVLLGGLYKATAAPQGKDGSATDVMAPPKRALAAMDLTREAFRAGVPLVMSRHHPARSVEALRLILAAPTPALRETLTHDLFRAYWVEGVNIADLSSLARYAASAGVSMDAIESPSVKAALTANTDEALAVGAFGVPTFLVNNPDTVGTRIFFGQDRFHFAAAAALGPGNGHPLTRPLRLKDNGTPTVIKSLRVYYDFSSPWAYLGVLQMPAFQMLHGVAIEFVPILLGALFKEIGTPNMPALAVSEAKRAYGSQDMNDYVKATGIPFQFTSTFPLRTVLPLRIATQEPRIMLPMYAAAWRDDKNIGDPAVVEAVLNDAGFDGKALIAAAESAEAKATLRQNTEDAIKAGLCGVPSFEVTSQSGERVLLWGQDRLNVLADIVHGWNPTEPPSSKL